MKRTFFIGFLLLLHVCVNAQGYYKRTPPKVGNICEQGPDSVYRYFYDPQYPEIAKTYYQYDDQHRINFMSQYEGQYQVYNLQRFFKRLPNGFSDSSITMRGSIVSGSIKIYNNDSFLTNVLKFGTMATLDDVRVYEEIEYSYNFGPDITVVNGKTWTIPETGPKKPSNYFYLAKLRGDVLIADSSWGKTGRSYSRSYFTYASDTIIYHNLDSNFYDSVYNYTSMDSSVVITSRSGDQKVVSRLYAQLWDDAQGYHQYQLNKSIDTTFSSGNSLNYFFDDKEQKYVLKGKTNRSQHGNVGTSYRLVNGKWVNQSKGESYYIDEGGKCLGTHYSYFWKEGTWEISDKSVYYYSGLSADRTYTNDAPCKLPNPFSVSYPFNCEALVSEEEYTLRVFDLSGKKVLDEEFFVDQSIGELVMLQGGNLYYFVISNSQNELISKQKILMGY